MRKYKCRNNILTFFFLLYVIFFQMLITLIFPSFSSLHTGFHLSFLLSSASVCIAPSCSVLFLLSALPADALHAEQGLEWARALPAAGEAVLPFHLMSHLCPLIIRMCWIQQSHFSLVWQHISRVGENPTPQHTLIQEGFPQQTWAFFSSGKRELDSPYGHPTGCSITRPPGNTGKMVLRVWSPVLVPRMPSKTCHLWLLVENISLHALTSCLRLEHLSMLWGAVTISVSQLRPWLAKLLHLCLFLAVTLQPWKHFQGFHLQLAATETALPK